MKTMTERRDPGSLMELLPLAEEAVRRRRPQALDLNVGVRVLPCGASTIPLLWDSVTLALESFIAEALRTCCPGSELSAGLRIERGAIAFEVRYPASPWAQIPGAGGPACCRWSRFYGAQCRHEDGDHWQKRLEFRMPVSAFADAPAA